jgi:ATP-dependent DNA helicase RecG
MYDRTTLSSKAPIEKCDKAHQSKPFNPTMAAVFYKCGFIENWGRGTTGIIEECMKYGLPKPTFEYEWTAVVTSFYKADQKSTKGEGVNEGVNEGVISLYALIKSQPNNRSTFFADKLNTSVKNIERWLKQLKDEDRIEFRGAPKTGGYFAK